MNRLTKSALKKLEILLCFEHGDFHPTSTVAAALEATTLTFIVFACLGTKQGKEELRLDLNETIFMKRFRRRAEKLFQEFAAANLPATLTIILPDLEPRRTWGWNVPQEELSGLCQLMIDDATPQLPQGWSAVLWSELEERAEAASEYAQALEWGRTSAPPLLVRGEQLFFRELSERHPDILIKGDPETLARRQIAAYAHEGRVLEKLFPTGILLQTDTPIERKDAMFMQLRSDLLAIAHPFMR